GAVQVGRARSRGGCEEDGTLDQGADAIARSSHFTGDTGDGVFERIVAAGDVREIAVRRRSPDRAVTLETFGQYVCGVRRPSHNRVCSRPALSGRGEARRQSAAATHNL